MTPLKYVITTAVCFALLSISAILFNFFVDPFLIMDRPRIKGFNLYKVDINDHVRISKAYHPAFSDWNTLMVGNSRIEMGLDPAHRCLNKIGARAYNLGSPGASVRQQLEYALNLVYRQEIRRIFVSVDFVDFLVPAGSKPPVDSDNWRVPSGSLRYTFDGSLNPAYRLSILSDYYRGLFSFDSTISSLRTVLLQAPYRPDRSEQGFNPARDFKHSVQIEGSRALFTQKVNELENKYSQAWDFKYLDGSPAAEFDVLLKFLQITAAKKIDVVLFTNPFHDRFWDILRVNSLYEKHSEWLEELESLVLAFSLIHKNRVALWDFSGESPFIHESVPDSNSVKVPLKWFWEPAHYRRQLGDLMLETMLSNECRSRRHFGHQLI